ncbi:MAG: hypothetical protein ABR564_09730 [Candidatus Dormibacteria bacterium]
MDGPAEWRVAAELLIAPYGGATMTTMTGLLIGVLIAAILWVITGGHVFFLPLFFLLPLGGLMTHRRRRW